MYKNSAEFKKGPEQQIGQAYCALDEYRSQILQSNMSAIDSYRVSPHFYETAAKTVEEERQKLVDHYEGRLHRARANLGAELERHEKLTIKNFKDSYEISVRKRKDMDVLCGAELNFYNCR